MYMKTESKPRPQSHERNGRVAAKRVTVKGRRMVMLPESEFDRLLQKADEWEPLLPAPNERGNYPALETLDVLLARDILRHRRRLGLSQAELARLAGIRPETLNRIEQGKRSPSVRTVDKIDRALREAEAQSPSS
jgi:DNA-binding XRE family transcriptional regulator